jgi:MAF protein
MRIILASQSPFRKKALDLLGLKYETIPSNFDEKTIREKNPMLLAKKLSEAKARTVGANEKDAIIISADHFVVFNGRIIEKPVSKQEAISFWQSFSGKKIDIVAGVSVYNSSTKKMNSAVGKHTVKWRKIEPYEMEDYVSRYPVTTLAAGFEGDALLRFAEKSHGEYPFLTGLPLSRLVFLLRKNGIRC